jgi:hypothetical protein
MDEWHVVLRNYDGRIVLFNPIKNQIKLNQPLHQLRSNSENDIHHIQSISSDPQEEEEEEEEEEREPSSSSSLVPYPPLCPLCHRPIPSSPHLKTHSHRDRLPLPAPPNPSYFSLLSTASTPLPSRPSTPTLETPPLRKGKARGLDRSARVDGYYDRFFREIRKLGRGARGTVYLVRHILGGEELG